MSNAVRLRLATVEGNALRFTAVTSKGLETAVDSGPAARDPSPVDTLLIALAGCHAMDVIAILRKKQLDVTGYEIEVTGERRSEHPRAFTRIDLTHRLFGHGLTVAPIEQAIALSHEKYCSVQASLDPRIVVTNHLEIVETDARGAAPEEGSTPR